MKKLNQYILWFYLIILMSFSACYDDLGNYEYKDINDMEISMPKEINVNIPKHDSVLVSVKATVQHTLFDNKSSLQYQWKKRIGNGKDWEICGTDSIYNFYVYPSNKENIFLRVAITDPTLNIVTYEEILVKMVYSYERCWFVLQEINGNAVLGSIDGNDASRIIAKDVYKVETGGQLNGKPLFIMANTEHKYGKFDAPQREPLIGIFTDRESFLLDGGNLQTRYTYDRMLLHKRITGDKNFQPWFAQGDYGGECVIDNGVFWYAMGDGHSIYYPVSLNPDITGGYKATLACVSYYRGLNIIFDDQNKRFLWYSNNNYGSCRWTHERINYDGQYNLYSITDPKANGSKLELITESDYRNQFDPNNIGADQEMIFMGPTSDSDFPKILSIATNGTTLFIYEINPSAIVGEDNKSAYCSGYFEFTPTEKASKDVIAVATSTYFHRMFFYAIGNKIYRVDCNRQIPRSYLIYEHPESSVVIAGLKFRSPRTDRGYKLPDMSDEDDYLSLNLQSYLGAIVKYQDGSGDALVEMRLTKAGDVYHDKETQELITYEFKGFENVIDFVYSFR